MSDLGRYSRQVVLPEVGVNGQAMLADSCVLLIGMGALGSAAASCLAGAGVGHLMINDFDRLQVSNLHRQLLYRETDVGRCKVDAAKAQLGGLNAQLEITTLPQRLPPDALQDAVRQADVVLDCSDNFPTRFAVNAACVAMRKPLVCGAAIRLEGQLCVFDLRHGGPCYACLYPQTGEAAERCEDAGILGPVSQVIGGLQALAAIKLLIGIEQPIAQLQVWDALRMENRTLKLSSDPACGVCSGTKND